MIANGKLYLCSNEETTLDDNYRYQVDLPIISHAMKKGKPITVFENLSSFASSVCIDEELLMKCISFAFSCSHTKNTFKGLYPEDIVRLSVANIVMSFLLCMQCDRPELDLKSKSKGLKQTCRACGFKYYVKNSHTKQYDAFCKHYST